MVKEYIKKEIGKSCTLNWDFIPSTLREVIGYSDSLIRDIGYVSASGNIFLDLNSVINIAINNDIECTTLVKNLLRCYYPYASFYIDDIIYDKDNKDYKVVFSNKIEKIMFYQFSTGTYINTYSMSNDTDKLKAIEERTKGSYEGMKTILNELEEFEEQGDN